MPPAKTLDQDANRITLQLFADRLIDWEEAEERTGFSHGEYVA